MMFIKMSLLSFRCALLLALPVVAFVGCRSSEPIATAPAPALRAEVSALVKQRALNLLVSGELFAAKEQHAQAILEFQDALKLMPNEAAIHFAIAKSYRALRKSESALSYAKKAVELDSTNKWYNELLGNLYFDLQNYSAAAEQFELFSLKDPQSSAALYQLAAAQVAGGQLQEALNTYTRLLGLVGLDLDVLYKKLLLQIQLKMDNDAVLTLIEMIVSDPENLDLYQMLGELYIKLGRYDDALRAYQDLLDRNPNDLRALVAFCEIYTKQKDWKGFETTVNDLFNNPNFTKEDKLNIGYLYIERAEKDTAMLKPTEIVMLRLQKAYPNEWQPYWFLSIIYLRARNYTSAIPQLQRLTAMKPDFAPAWENLGIAYLSIDENNSAINTFKLALEKASQPSFRMKVLLGTSLNQAYRDEESVRVLTEALSQMETEDTSMIVQAYSALALSYERLKRYDESEQSYETALLYEPDNALVLNNLAYSYSERDKELPRALNMAKVAVAKEPNNGAYLDTMGWIYFKMGNYEEAKSWIEKAVQSGRESPAVLEHLGDVYSKLGDREKALHYYEKALRINRTSVSLQQKLEAIK
jgi:tetratricopeptide (TPR) repeat protein